MKSRDLLILIGLLWVAFFLRVHLIDTLPPFNDESLHIRRSEVVFQERDVGLVPSKTLVYFWVGAFDVDREGDVWLGRTAISLFALLGLAGVYATGKSLFSREAGLIALVLAIFSPFMLFFDRLFLSDPFAAALAILLLWFTVRWAKKPTTPNAIGTGVLLFLVIFAKILNLAFLALPPLALILYQTHTLPTTWRIRPVAAWLYKELNHHRRTLITLYIAFSVCWIPSILHVLERTLSGEQLMFVNNNLVAGLAEDQSPIEIVLQNFGTLWDVNWILHSPILWLPLIASSIYLVWKQWRESLLLLASVGMAWSLAIFLGAELSTRYLLPGTLIAFLIVAGAADQLRRDYSYTKWIVNGIIAIWIAVFALPFAFNAWHSPTKLAMPPRDEWEYFSNFSSGYGLVDAADDLYNLPISQPSERVNVFGLVGSCHQMRLYLPHATTDADGPVWLTCLDFGWYGENIPQNIDDIQVRLAIETNVYLLIEPDLPFFDINDLDGHWQWELVKTYSRPHDGMPIVLYHIRPLNETRLTTE